MYAWPQRSSRRLELAAADVLGDPASERPVDARILVQHDHDVVGANPDRPRAVSDCRVEGALLIVAAPGAERDLDDRRRFPVVAQVIGIRDERLLGRAGQNLKSVVGRDSDRGDERIVNDFAEGAQGADVVATGDVNEGHTPHNRPDARFVAQPTCVLGCDTTWPASTTGKEDRRAVPRIDWLAAHVLVRGKQR